MNMAMSMNMSKAMSSSSRSFLRGSASVIGRTFGVTTDVPSHFAGRKGSVLGTNNICPRVVFPAQSCMRPSPSFFSTATSVDQKHPLDALTAEEIKAASAAVRAHFQNEESVRFVAVTLLEPKKTELLAYTAQNGEAPKRMAEVLVLVPSTGVASQLNVSLEENDSQIVASVASKMDLPPGSQPMFTPEDCDLAEEIVKSSAMVRKIVKERYDINDMETELVCDPWSVHLANANDRELTFYPKDDDSKSRHSGATRRLVQTFLYQRTEGLGTMDDNHYSHPIDILPVVDLNTREVVHIDGLDRDPPPKVPQSSANYNRRLLSKNSYLANTWREDVAKTLNVVQPDGPSFSVSPDNVVTWQNWSIRVGFNYREGLVLHDVRYNDRPILHRGSLVEMAVPYGDPHPPYQRKCAFDVGDYGLGYCANSLELGCDCLGHIHYFDAVMADAEGQPVVKKKAICMHEEDDGILWKHVEYRNGNNESRRSRVLVLSFIATVVNYEYLFYWRFKQDGTVDFEIRLSGELSTNLMSEEEEKSGKPTHGTLVAPGGVNAQIHQHMFCARLDMAVDGTKNTVSEIDVVPNRSNDPYGNVFEPMETVLQTEQGAVRTFDANKARSWKISNAEEKNNPISGKPVAFKLHPFTTGPAHPTLLTDMDRCAVNQKGKFATAHLWVTKHDDEERYPAGECTPQGDGSGGLHEWIEKDRNIEGEDVVLWHSFGVTHVPRVEDFPVMPCESTGFTLKPDGFFNGNPAIDLPPDVNEASELSKGSSCCD